MVRRKYTRFGKELTKFLMAKRMTITELAKEMGRSQPMISQAMREPPAMEDAKRQISEHIKKTYGINIEP